MTPTDNIRDIFTQEVCKGCIANEVCPKDMENQSHCAALLTWKNTLLLLQPKEHLTHNTIGMPISSSPIEKIKFVDDQCAFVNCKYRRTCETNGYICPAVIRVNKLE